MQNENWQAPPSTSKSHEVRIHGPSRILCVGDTHMPYTDSAKLDLIVKEAIAVKPTAIVQVGDLYDMYCFSRFARSVDFITPAKEIAYGRKMAVDMWMRLRQAAPNAKLFQLKGNHELRLWKKILGAAPEYESLLKEPVANLFRFSGVYAFQDYRSELVINDIVFHHGWKPRIGDHARWYGKSTVCGHLHRGDVVWVPRKGIPLFEMNCGFIADVNQLPMEYGETKTNSWVSGFGLIDEKGPRFIRL